jgi:hypothetical protein
LCAADRFYYERGIVTRNSAGFFFLKIV